MIRVHHGGPVGHSAAVLIALAEKSLAYGGQFVDLAEFEQLDPGFLALHPAGPLIQLISRSQMFVLRQARDV